MRERTGGRTWYFLPASGDFFERQIDRKPQFPAHSDHFVGPARRATHPQHAIAFLEKLNGNGVEDFVERLVSDALRPSQMDKRKSEPFADQRDVAGTKNPQRECLHETNISRQKIWIIVSTGPVGPGNQNHLWWF